MCVNPCWIILGSLLLALVFILIERCMKYSKSLPEEDIGIKEDVYHWEEKETWPNSLLG
jgi:hypothetical protein